MIIINKYNLKAVDFDFENELSIFNNVTELELIKLIPINDSISHLSAIIKLDNIKDFDLVQFPSREINVEFEISVDKPLALTNIKGIVGLFGYNFMLSLDINFFYATLHDEKLKLSEFLKSFIGYGIDIPLGNTVVTGAVFKYYYEDKVIALNVETNEDIDILGNGQFNVSNVGFHVQLWDGKLMAAKLYGVCSISNLDFDVSGTFEKDNGFTFEFSLADHNFSDKAETKENKIDLSKFLEKLGIAKTVLPKIEVSGLEFSFNSRTKDIHFKIECDWDLKKELGYEKSADASSKVFLDLKTSLSKEGSPTLWTIGADIKLDKTDLNVVMNHDSSGNSYSFSGEELNINLGSLLNDIFSKIKIPGNADESSFDKVFNGLSSGLNVFTVTDFSINHNPSGSDLQLKIKTEELNFSSLLVALGAGNPLKDYKEFDPSITEVDLSYSSKNDVKQYSISCYLGNGKNPASLIFKASAVSQGEDVHALIGNIYGTDGKNIDLGDSFPIRTSINDLFLAHINLEEEKVNLFGVDFSVRGHVDLSTLPVVGRFMADAKFSFDAIRVVYSSEKIKAADLDSVNEFLANLNIAPLIVKRSTVTGKETTPEDFSQGFNLQGTIKIGDEGKSIPLFSKFNNAEANTADVNNDKSKPNTTVDASNAISKDSPSPIGKKFGPVSISSVSIGLSAGKVTLTLNAALQIGPLNVELIGMNLKSPLQEFSPEIGLHGLGFSFDKPPLEMSGLFLKSTTTIIWNNVETPIKEAYSGSLSVGYKDYSLIMMGSYATLPDGATSIFIYGYFGAPIAGVPGVLMITGVAMGMGYNRSISLPKAKDIKSFPLVSAVLQQKDPDKGDAKKPVDFDAMNKFFLPMENAFWGAIGLKLEAFNMIDAFVLLILNFGSEFEIGILGIAEMKFPVPDEDNNHDPLATLIIGVEARILPERGILLVTGDFLPGSYVFNPKATLTGGFAFLNVFKDQRDGEWNGAKEGDFVLTIGGYHPSYKHPEYYPKASRFEMNWKVNDNLSLKSSTYFAITPDAMMIGGNMIADFNAGGTFAISVHFTMDADFIIYWKPFHYLGNAHAALNVSASINVDCWLFSIHQSVHFNLSADLRIWGPEFSGYASVSVHVLVSFTVGISFGDPEVPVNPLSWEEFRTSFLPCESKSKNESGNENEVKDKILSVNIGEGLIASQSKPAKDTDLAVNVVNPKELKIMISSAFPIKEIKGINKPINGNVFGIKPMGKTEGDISESTLTITIKKADSIFDNPEHFTFNPITKNMPAALWQPAEISGQIPELPEKSMVENLITGVEISAGKPDIGHEIIVSREILMEDNIYQMSSGYSDIFEYDESFTRS